MQGISHSKLSERLAHPVQGLGLQMIISAAQEAKRGHNEAVDFLMGSGLDEIIQTFGLNIKSEFVRGWYLQWRKH